LLRGPQTLGELRGRASRMANIESIDAAKDLLRRLSDRAEPLVREIAPSPGSRAERYAQLLCPELHALQANANATANAPANSGAAEAQAPSLAARVEQLEAQVAA